MYLLRGHAHGPRPTRKISSLLTRKLTAWQTFCITLTCLYVLKNTDRLLGLGAPEPLARLYSRSFYRATWFTTALDAGFFTALPIRTKWARDVASILFSAYYLVFADQADEKVRKIRATITVPQLRASWEKNWENPYLRLATRLNRPTIRSIVKLAVARPIQSEYKGGLTLWRYYNGRPRDLKKSTTVVFFIPGGGYVSMTPRNYDESVALWAQKLDVPVVAVQYKHAPEYPYPYALHECFDTFVAIMETNGACIGLDGNTKPRVALVGDSAGGNFVAAVTLMVLSHNHEVRAGSIVNGREIELPSGLVMLYPNLDFTMTSWMSEDQLQVIKSESLHDITENVLSTKRDYSSRRSLLLPDHDCTEAINHHNEEKPVMKIQPIGTQLAMTSRSAYVQDRIISTDLMRAMVILYIGPSNKPNFEEDYFLSPLRAPASFLADFPQTFFICGEKDPLVDDTIILAGRIREAKQMAQSRRRDLAMTSMKSDHEVDVTMVLVKGRCNA